MIHFLSQPRHDGDEVRWRLLFSGFYHVVFLCSLQPVRRWSGSFSSPEELLLWQL